VRRDYELGFILHPEVSEERTRSILDRIEQIVTQHNGQVVRVNHWGRRRLAYPIQHHRDGTYVFVDMIAPPETLPELDRILKVSEEVLRHLIKRRDPRVVQKEREAHTAAAAAAATASPAAPTTTIAETAPAGAPEAAPTETTGAEAVEAALTKEVEQPATADVSEGSSESSESPESPSESPEAEAPALSPEELEGAPPALAEHPAGESEG
jgi:small subunit ribosomal protein S6